MNPWEMQKELMMVSGQKIGLSVEGKYTLNNTSLLYAALILEEVSELMDGLTKILIEEGEVSLSNCTSLSLMATHESSVAIRRHLTTMKDMNITLSKENIIELVDASTDIAVVNAGFAVAVGFDGAACYDNVATSNLSKANPVTGQIDKDSSGKWIKGVNYTAPTLEEVLFKHWC